MKRRLSYEMLAVFGSRIGVAMMGTVTGILLARGLGPHDRGLLALVLLLPSTLMTVTKLGITQANVYCVRREGARLDEVATNSLVLGLGLSAICCIATWLLRDVLATTVMRGVPMWALALALVRLPLLLVDNFFCGVLQAMGNFSLYNRRTLAGAAFVLVLLAVAKLFWDLDLQSAVLVYTAVPTIVVVSLLVATHRMVPFGWRPNGALLERQMRFGLKSYVQILTMHLLFRIDVYMVSYFLDPAQTAFYSLALHFTEMILEIPQAVGWVIYPKMASLQKEDVHRLTAQACRRTILLTATGGLGAVLFGPVLIPLWYGSDFAAASRPLAFATVGAVMMSIFTILSRDFTSRNRQRVNINAGLTALVSNVALNIALIPVMGISGVALATSLAYMMAAIMLLIPFRYDSGLSMREVLVPNAEDVRFVWNAARDGLGRWIPILRPRPPLVSANRSTAEIKESPVTFVPCESAEEWDALVAKQPHGTVFHRMVWLRMVAERRTAQLQALVVHQGEEAVGVFPLFVRRRGLFRIAMSPPPQAATPYLGPLVPAQLIAPVVAALRQRLRTQRISYFEIRFQPEPDAAGRSTPGFEMEKRATFLLDLRPGPDQLWAKSLSSSCRRAIRKATNSGVQIVEGDLEENLDRYFDMAKQVYAKSNRPPSLDRNDYAALAALARSGGGVKVLFAYHEGRLVSGGIFPYDERTIYYLDGASDLTGQDVRPNNLLHWEVIRWACEQGLSSYDMVGAGIESIARFKRGFGPAEIPYMYAYCSLDRVTGAARSIYGRLAPAVRSVQHTVQKWTARNQGGVAVETPSNE